MTDLPYTDKDLRTLAARVHEAASRDSDHRVNSAVKRQWGAQLDTDQLDEAGDALIAVLDRAANTSRWAVELGNDGLRPDVHTIDVGWDDGPLQARLLIAFDKDMPDDEREQLAEDIRDAVAGTVPVR